MTSVTQCGACKAENSVIAEQRGPMLTDAGTPYMMRRVRCSRCGRVSKWKMPDGPDGYLGLTNEAQGLIYAAAPQGVK